MSRVSPVFAGRDDEMTVLAEAVAADSTVLLGGEAGVGKTRLLEEFVPRIDTTVLTGGCVDLGVPYAPFIEALRPIAREIGPEPGGLAALLPGFDLPPGETPDIARARLFEEVLVLLERLGATLIIEDVHWADRSSRDLILFLVHNKAPRIIVSYRSDELHRGHPLRPWLAQLDRIPWVRRLDLVRLARDAVAVQLGGILGRRPAPGLVETIYERSEGNPLFVEALHEGGDLPDSLRDLLLLPIDRLPEETREVLGAISCGLAAVSHTLITKVTGRDDKALRPAVTANVLGVADDDSYAFRHALIREAVYSHLLPGERTRMHQRYAEALPEASIEAAHHWHAAHVDDRAIRAAWAAASSAGRGLAWAEQLELLERILRLWDRIPEAEKLIGADRLTVLEQTVDAAYWAGRHERAIDYATSALSEMPAGARAVRLLLLRGYVRWTVGRPGDIDDFREAVRLAPAGDPSRAIALAELASRLELVPRTEEARRLAADALELAGDGEDGVLARVALGQIAADTGDFDAGMSLFAEARAMADAGSPNALTRPYIMEAYTRMEYGRHEEAVALSRRCLELTRQDGIPWTEGHWVGVALAEALFALGRWDQLLEIIEDALERDALRTARAHLLRIQGRILLARGESGVPELDEIREVLTRDDAWALDLLQMAQLEIELDPGRAREVLSEVPAEILEGAPSWAWPLVVTAAQAGFTADVAGRLPVVGPLQEAHRLTFLAHSDPALWDDAASAWAGLRQPYSQAGALHRAAAAVIRDRDAAAVRLREAHELASSLSAAPLCARIEQLARRTRVSVGSSTGRPAPYGLTPRELEVLRLVAEGRSNRDIAGELFISTKTASVHISNITAKLDVSGRGEAAALAHRLALVE